MQCNAIATQVRLGRVGVGDARPPAAHDADDNSLADADADAHAHWQWQRQWPPALAVAPVVAKRFKPEFACNCAFEVRCRSDAYCRRKHSPAHRCLLSCCGLRCSDADAEWAPPTAASRACLAVRCGAVRWGAVMWVVEYSTSALQPLCTRRDCLPPACGSVSQTPSAYPLPSPPLAPASAAPRPAGRERLGSSTRWLRYDHLCALISHSHDSSPLPAAPPPLLSSPLLLAASHRIAPLVFSSRLVSCRLLAFVRSLHCIRTSFIHFVSWHRSQPQGTPSLVSCFIKSSPHTHTHSCCSPLILCSALVERSTRPPRPHRTGQSRTERAPQIAYVPLRRTCWTGPNQEAAVWNTRARSFHVVHCTRRRRRKSPRVACTLL